MTAGRVTVFATLRRRAGQLVDHREADGNTACRARLPQPFEAPVAVVLLEEEGVRTGG